MWLESIQTLIINLLGCRQNGTRDIARLYKYLGTATRWWFKVQHQETIIQSRCVTILKTKLFDQDIEQPKSKENRNHWSRIKCEGGWSFVN